VGWVEGEKEIKLLLIVMVVVEGEKAAEGKRMTVMREGGINS